MMGMRITVKANESDGMFGYVVNIKIGKTVHEIVGCEFEKSLGRARLLGLRHALEEANKANNKDFDIVVDCRNDPNTYLYNVVSFSLRWLNDGWKTSCGDSCANIDILKKIVPYIYDARINGRAISARKTKEEK